MAGTACWRIFLGTEVETGTGGGGGGGAMRSRWGAERACLCKVGAFPNWEYDAEL